MSLQIINRRGYLHEWNQAEAASPPTGNLRRGEIAIAIVTSDGTDTGDIVEVIGRIGPSDTPTPFSDCPVVFRSPRGFKGADVRPVLVDEEPSVDSVLAYDSANNKFVSLDEDPGTYEEDDSENNESEGVLTEVAPTILSSQISGLGGENIEGVARPYTISVGVAGRPDPVLHVEITETEYPDPADQSNNSSTIRYSFNSADLPQGVSLSTSVDSSTPDGLGTITYLLSGLEAIRSSPMDRLDITARVYGDNPAGASSTSTLSASIRFTEDPATAALDPTLTRVSISEGGSETFAIPNLATDASATLTANYVASNFTSGVANGTVSYQWSVNGAELVGETSSTLTLVNTNGVYNDSQIRVDVSIIDDNGTDFRSGYLVVGDYDEGFTELVPSADSRLIYVANDGDDVAASNVYGRGYYLPSDPEIGPDPTNPVGPIVAYATPDHGWSRIRHNKWLSESGNFDTYQYPGTQYTHSTLGFPDWILYKRGDTFATGKGNRAFYNNYPDGGGWGGRHGAWAGRSASEPGVMTAWGTPTDPRPVFTGNLGPGPTDVHIRYVSLDVLGSMAFASYSLFDRYDEDVLVEDCRAKTFGGNNVNVNVGLRYRRCAVSGTFNASAHNQGLFISSYGGEGGWIQNAAPDQGGSPLTDVVFEECVFDRNGYKEDPYDASTWTAAIWGGNGVSAVSPGLGVQPRRTYFDRNIYVSTGAGPDRLASVTLRGCLFSRAGGGGSVQMRQGGVVDRCVWVGDLDAGFIGNGDGIYKDCLRLGSEIFHNQSYYNSGFLINKNADQWPNTWGSVIDGCIVAGGTASGRPAFNLQLGATNISSVNVAVVNTDVVRHGPSGVSSAFSSTPFASATLDNNREYINDPASSGWNGVASMDCNAAAAVFGAGSDPCRDIVSYMASVDPDYASLLATDPATNPNHPENVHVDEDCTVKQADRVLVRDVWTHNLSEDRSATLNRSALTDADARLLARRYHAFLTFIERAKDNRKHAWDSRWTADALNTYIREGVGKTAVAGPYTASLADIPSYGGA